MSAMSESPRTMDPPTADSARHVLRYNYAQLTKRFLARVCIFGALCVTPAVLYKLGAPNTVWAVLPAIPGGIGITFTVLNFLPAPFRLRRCGRVLKHYPLEPQPNVRNNGHSHTLNGTVFTFTVKDQEIGRSRRLVAVDPQGRGRWPEGTKDGVWMAGDLPFGGVVVVPSSGALLLMRPEKWEETVPEREQAGADRITRAKEAGLGRKSL